MNARAFARFVGARLTPGASLAPNGAFYSHRSLVPSGLRISASFPPVSGVETVAPAPTSLAGATHYSVR